MGIKMVFWRIVAAIMVTVVATGCSPEYNWREVAVGDHVGMVLFPAKPRVETRELAFGVHALQFTLTTSKVGKSIFAVGSAPWPATLQKDESLQQEVGRSVMASLYQNLGSQVPDPLPPLGEGFEIGAGATRLQGRVWVSKAGLTEGVVMAPEREFPNAAAAEFLDSVASGR